MLSTEISLKTTKITGVQLNYIHFLINPCLFRSSKQRYFSHKIEITDSIESPTLITLYIEHKTMLYIHFTVVHTIMLVPCIQ